MVCPTPLNTALTAQQYCPRTVDTTCISVSPFLLLTKAILRKATQGYRKVSQQYKNLPKHLANV